MSPRTARDTPLPPRTTLLIWPQARVICMSVKGLSPAAPRTPNGGRKDGGSSLAAFLGPLEIQVLECLWRQPAETSVRKLQESFSGAAYTTLMTTLDRLFKKGLLDRRLSDRAFLYVPRFTREGLEKHLAAGVIARLLGEASSRWAARPILSTLVEAVDRRDAALLDELEALIKSHRLKGPVSDRGEGGR
jgi:predicted transcriptional regulator